jgi:hypothetical protein
MTVINAIGSLPGLGRLIVQYLIETAEPTEKDLLRAKLLPTPLHTRANPFSNLDSTINALKDIGILSETGGRISLSAEAAAFLQGSQLTRARYRRLLQHFVFSSADVDPWKIAANDTLTSGSKDINRALSWSLAQDVRSTLTWDKIEGGMTSAQLLQKEQLPNVPDLQPFSNDARWGTFVRWSIALGFAQPAFVGAGIYPDATVAIRDVVFDMPSGRVSIDKFLDGVATRLPVLRGGALQASFLELSSRDPDPDSARGELDSTLAQAILALEEESVIDILPLEADAPSRTIGLDDLNRRITHLQIWEAAGKSES